MSRAPFAALNALRRLAAAGLGLLALTSASSVAAQTDFASSPSATPPAPWRAVNLAPAVPATQFDVARIDAVTALRVRTNRSYGNLVHPWSGAAGTLSWRWRLEQPLATSNLRTREGDDVALKVCLMFDLPLQALSFSERTLLSLARARSGEALPAATLCYIWDTRLPVGTGLANAYSARLRYLVLNTGAPAPGQWVSHQRDVDADFRAAFGHESRTTPPVVALLVGGDSDNTAGASIGYVADLILRP